jgi:hypothetical protein
MNITAESLVLVARLLCPWQPEYTPPLTILTSVQYEAAATKYGASVSGRSFVMPHHLASPIFMRLETANDRILCHEWRHIVEPAWNHE